MRVPLSATGHSGAIKARGRPGMRHASRWCRGAELSGARGRCSATVVGRTWWRLPDRLTGAVASIARGRVADHRGASDCDGEHLIPDPNPAAFTMLTLGDARLGRGSLGGIRRGRLMRRGLSRWGLPCRLPSQHLMPIWQPMRSTSYLRTNRLPDVTPAGAAANRSSFNLGDLGYYRVRCEGNFGGGREPRDWRDATWGSDQASAAERHCFLAFQQATTSLASSTVARRQRNWRTSCPMAFSMTFFSSTRRISVCGDELSSSGT
jgi:hypothetical protein